MEDGSPAAWDLTVEFMETVQLNRQRYMEEVRPSDDRDDQAAERGLRLGNLGNSEYGKPLEKGNGE